MGLLNKFRKHEEKLNYQQEILEHVCDLLNTKKKFGVYPLEYGIDSYVYMGSDKKIVMEIIADIKGNLEKYEKRLQCIEIQSVPSPNRFLLSFLIKCKIEENPYSFHLSFHHQKNLFHLEAKP